MENTVRIALANNRPPTSGPDAVALASQAIHDAGQSKAGIICFPECFVPGYRGLGYVPEAPNAPFLERAWSAVAESTAKAKITVILGTERVVEGIVIASALVINPDGSHAGFQDKVQIDPPEEGIYTPGTGRRVFQAGQLTFGIVICHEGFRYPETVRWAARRGAQVVFHPHFHPPVPGAFQPKTYGDPANSFHERALHGRAAENTCYFATVNCAVAGSPTTSAVIRPDGTALCHQPYGQEGLLIADLDLSLATGLLVKRYKPTDEIGSRATAEAL